jgi:hypothetical protein
VRTRPNPYDVVPAFDAAPQQAADTEALSKRLQEMMTARDQSGPTQRRDVHAKMHAVVRAEFTVADDLPPDLRVGLFANPATYKAWVRFSNASNNINPDTSGDIRGMAIKVMGVPGRKVLDSEADASTHDFITISAQNFLTCTARQTDILMAALTGSLWDKLVYGLTHPKVAWILMTTMLQHANVLQLRYFSAVPYAFGPLAVKYVVTPHVDQADEMPPAPGPDFLRQAAAATLATRDVTFDFAVQFQRDEDSMPVEDPTRVWSLELSPPRRVASVRIPQQTFDTAEIDAFGEGLSMSPWHCLPEHRPLGEINRARKLIYEALSIYRHQKNQQPRREPTGWDV